MVDDTEDARPVKPTAAAAQQDRFSPAVFATLAAFGTYFCMYAFRKPFTAATFEGLEFGGFGYKSILITSQLAGYTLSKFLGIPLVSAWPSHRRAVGIIGLIAVAEISLVLFAITPAPWAALFLFCNGLPLGMVFGLVLAYLEGRRLTEAMAAGLCASFIVSSGIVKSIGRWLIVSGVSEPWMPALTGLIFVVPLLAFVAWLARTPPPSIRDVQLRHERTPMNWDQRLTMLSRHRLGLSVLVAIFVLLTVVRSLRDDFAVEIWQGLGYSGQPSIFGWSETAVMFGVLAINGLAVRIVDSRAAFLTSLGLVLGGLVLVLASLAGQAAGVLPGFAFMVLIGLGMYVPYVAFHTTVFERLLAAFRDVGNIGFLMYLADSAGYLGYVGLLLTKDQLADREDYLNLFVTTTGTVTVLGIVLSLVAVFHYRARLTSTTPAAASTTADSSSDIASKQLNSPAKSTETLA